MFTVTFKILIGQTGSCMADLDASLLLECGLYAGDEIRLVQHMMQDLGFFCIAPVRCIVKRMRFF